MIGAILSRLYPAAAATGTQGLPIPDPVNLARLAEELAGAGVLAGPADFDVTPDLPARPCAATPEAMFAALLHIGAQHPRSWLAAAYPTRLQAHFVCRSARLNFPDIVVAEARQAGAGSVAAIFSYGVYGRSRVRAHRRRLADWLAQLDAALAPGSEG